LRKMSLLKVEKKGKTVFRRLEKGLRSPKNGFYKRFMKNS